MKNFLFQPLVLTSTPKPIKISSDASKRTIYNRNKFLKSQLEITSGSQDSAILQTGELFKSFGTEERKVILEKVHIKPAEIFAYRLVAMKTDVGIPWEKLKTISRYKTFLITYITL